MNRKRSVTKFGNLGIIQFLIGDQSFKTEHRFLNISLILGAIFFLFFILINIAFQINLALSIIKLFGFSLSVTLFYYSRFKKIFSWTSTTYFLSIIICFFFIGIKNGGVTGGIAPIYSAVLALMLFISSGNKLILLLVFWITSITSLFTVEYFYPDIITHYSNNNQKYIDLCLSYASGIIMISLVVVIVKKLYIREKLNLEELIEKYREYNIDLKAKINSNKLYLSVREREICELLLAGLTNREIAVKLFISEGTVKSHINSIYKKLGTKKRTEVMDLYQ